MTKSTVSRKFITFANEILDQKLIFCVQCEPGITCSKLFKILLYRGSSKVSKSILRDFSQIVHSRLGFLFISCGGIVLRTTVQLFSSNQNLVLRKFKTHPPRAGGITAQKIKFSINPVSINVPLMEKPGSWCLLVKCHSSTRVFQIFCL